ncbi:hypothetical protein Ddye_003770 [Dipteronia dyeriana]|uniref:TF-B3 domain-containing protein n=1 Tax=Dipteronia dyeriana TaxID=168575 RepID=A0AAD9XTH4_9ROSI|nr:hypothetical protein Ddye_003770 [Dipteronia dyeriana]
MGIFAKQNFRKTAAEAKERSIDIVRFLKPKNPSFMIILQFRSYDRYSLYVPAEFASKYFSRDVKIIKLQVSDGRELPVQIFWRRNEDVDLITGWSAFFKENNLEEGDVCLFELIRMEDFLLKRLPEKFVRKFGDELSAVVTLMVPNGRTWHVQLTKEEKKILFLLDGWHDFVKYYSISAGSFMVFKYRKNSSFHVLIFDQSACEIQYPIYHGGPNNDEQNSNQDEMKSDDSVETTGFTTPNSPSNSLKDKAVDKCRRSSSKMDTAPSQLNKPTLGSVLRTDRHGKRGASFETPKVKHPNNPGSSTQNELEEDMEEDTIFYGSGSPRKRTMTTVARESAFNAARVFEPVNPFCRVVLPKSYLYRKGCFMYFPSYFAKKHLRGVSEIIKLQTTDGKQRTTRCVYRGDSAMLTQGWYEFASENNLGEGDVCVFEVLKSSDIVLKVTVFRVLESDCQSKRCKIDVTDEKYNRTKFDDLKWLVSLEDMGISVSRAFLNNTAQEKERALAAARSIRPKHPSFMLILRRDNLKYYRVHVPSAFGSKYFSKDSKVIKVQDSGGREWPLRIYWHILFCIKGWDAFYREKNLRKGDICICELIRVNEPLLKVSIFKVNL